MSLSVDLKRDRLADRIGQRNDTVDLTLLHHSEAVDAQDHVEHIARIQILRLAVGIERDGALHAGIDLDIDLQLARELVDHFGERDVLQV